MSTPESISSGSDQEQAAEPGSGTSRHRISLRRFLVLFLLAAFPVVSALGAYLALTWPQAPLHYDGTEPFTLHVPGMGRFKMYLDPKDTVITPMILTTRSWEADETAWFLRTVQPGDTFVDAGANIGYYTILASWLVGDRGKVYAFEPEPKSFALLQKNVRLNGLTNVVLEQKALSNQPGVLELFIADQNRGDHRIYQPEGETRPSVEIEAVRLDAYLQGKERKIDVLKVDTQGAEGLILEGATGLLKDRTNAPAIFMEFWPGALQQMGTDAGALLEMLQSYHYRFYVFDPESRDGRTQIEPADLLATFPVSAPQAQTNMMAVPARHEAPED